MDRKIFELADRLKEAKEKKKEMEAAVKELNAQIEALDLALSDAMAEAECERFSHSGSTFYLNTRLFASPLEGRREEMILALKENGCGGIVTETVNANTLASFAKEQMEQNGDRLPEWLAEVVSTYEKVSVGIRKG